MKRVVTVFKATPKSSDSTHHGGKCGEAAGSGHPGSQATDVPAEDGFHRPKISGAQVRPRVEVCSRLVAREVDDVGCPG